MFTQLDRKQLLATTAALPLILGLGVGVAVLGGAPTGPDTAQASCNPCAAKNPCAASTCNPCAAKNPCAASACNPCAASACNPCNPCAAGGGGAVTECVVPRVKRASACNPCAAKNPCAASACNPCNPCAGANNPCAAKNPCAASACNPCAGANPCNPCAAANPCNPCAAKNPCNPCAAANPCNPCAANPCNPCAASATAEITDAEAAELEDCVQGAQADAYAKAGIEEVAGYQTWAQFSTQPYTSATHGGRWVNNFVNDVGAEAYGRYQNVGEMPVGSVAAKDSFTVDQNGNAVVGPLFVMEKMEAGFAPETGNWKYVMIMPNGTVAGETGTETGDQVQFCAGCHEAMENQDHLWFLPERYRANP